MMRTAVIFSSPSGVIIRVGDFHGDFRDDSNPRGESWTEAELNQTNVYFTSYPVRIDTHDPEWKKKNGIRSFVDIPVRSVENVSQRGLLELHDGRPRYFVWDTPETVVEREITADEFYRIFPNAHRRRML